jgi:hypothetical protein
MSEELKKNENTIIKIDIKEIEFSPIEILSAPIPDFLSREGEKIVIKPNNDSYFVSLETSLDHKYTHHLLEQVGDLRLDSILFFERPVNEIPLKWKEAISFKDVLPLEKFLTRAYIVELEKSYYHPCEYHDGIFVCGG